MNDVEPESVADDGIARAVAALGTPDAIYRASPHRQQVKFFAALGAIVFGIVANVLWFGVGPGNANHFILHFLYVPPAIGVGLLWHMWRHRGLRVLIFPQGLFRLQHGEAQSFPWSEILAIRCKLDLQGEPHIDRDDNGDIIHCSFETAAPTFQVWNVWLEVERVDGEKAKFTAALADFPDLVQRVQSYTFSVIWPGVKAQLASGQPVEFGPHITVTHDEIRSGKHVIPWRDVKSLGQAGRIFSVKRRGAWVAAIARDATTIPNLHILFALAVEHGVIDVTVEGGDDD